MKNRLLLFLCFLLAGNVYAQNPCAAIKSKAPHPALHKSNATPQQMDLMEKYDVTFHHLNLNVERTSTFLSGFVRTIAKSRVQNLDTFVFQLYNTLTVDSVTTFSGQKLNVIRQTDVAFVVLDHSYPTGSAVDLNIFYHGTPPSGASAAIGDGFSNDASPSYGNQITWSLSQPYSAYEWWPCKQSLQDKIDSVFSSITTDTSNKVGGNGLLKAVVPLGNGKHRYDWKTFYPMNFYLVMVTVGQYTEYRQYAKPRQIADSILIQHYIYNNPLAYSRNSASINATKSLVELFSDLYGLYPFYKEKYGHVMAPFSGGMEHQTMTSLGVFNFGIVAHELAHQWFGDNVTCATWKDIWLNEGFATYNEYLADVYLSPSSAVSDLSDMQNDARNGVGTVYVTDTANVTRLFSSQLTYSKGASAIRVLHYMLGDSMFFKVCRTYQSRYGNGNATTENFMSLVNELTATDYTWLFTQWIYGAGYPQYTTRWSYANGKLYVGINQVNGQDSMNVFTLPLQLRLTLASGDTILVVQNNLRSQMWEIPFPDSVTALKLDPSNWILKTSSVVYDGLFTGVNSAVAAPEFALYPNPAGDQVTVFTAENESLTVKVMDLQGKTQIDEKIQSGQTIQTDRLAAGLYLAQVTDGHGRTSTRRLLISR